MKIINFTSLFFVIFLLSSCKTVIDKNQNLNNSEENIMKTDNPEKSQMEVRFSCGDNGIKKFTDDGWTIINESIEEKICTWKSVPATKDCDMEKDKGCKITTPDKIGEEKIYLLER